MLGKIRVPRRELYRGAGARGAEGWPSPCPSGEKTKTFSERSVAGMDAGADVIAYREARKFTRSLVKRSPCPRLVLAPERRRG